MSYKPRSLFSLIEEVNHGLFLPHIQRPFVWDSLKMARLYDSLMRSYPIQTFLFWRTKDFIRARRFQTVVDRGQNLSALYDDNVSDEGKEKVFVLDGQQRLQTLYALFAGAVREKGLDLDAYADVTGGMAPDADGISYPLAFAEESPGPRFYRLRDLTGKDGRRKTQEIARELNQRMNAELTETEEERTARKERVEDNMGRLVSLLREDRDFWVEQLDGVANQYPYDVILDIFVRVNSGGTRLEPADLMFAAMKEGSAEIEERVDDVTDMLNGRHLAFDKSSVLKCLLLAHGRGSEATPDKFRGAVGKDTLKVIDEGWSRAEDAFEQLRDFIQHDLHLTSDALVRSYSAFVPVFDFLFHNPKPDEQNRALMRAYVYKAQLFNWYRARTDQLLNALHGVVGKPLGGAFPLAEIKAYFTKAQETVDLNTEHLQESRLRPILLHMVYVERFGADPFDTYFKGNSPQVDHIYPQSPLRRLLHLETPDVNHLGNFRFVGASDNNRKRAELPASYFARLKAAGIPIEKHLLLDDYAADPSKLEWSKDAYTAFRDKRLAVIEEVARRVVNPEAPAS